MGDEKARFLILRRFCFCVHVFFFFFREKRGRKKLKTSENSGVTGAAGWFHSWLNGCYWLNMWWTNAKTNRNWMITIATDVVGYYLAYPEVFFARKHMGSILIFEFLYPIQIGSNESDFLICKGFFLVLIPLYPLTDWDDWDTKKIKKGYIDLPCPGGSGPTVARTRLSSRWGALTSLGGCPRSRIVDVGFLQPLRGRKAQ